MKAGDIMTPTPFVISENDTIRSAAVAMRDLGIGCVPVVSAKDHQTLVGTITDRDITIRCTAKYHRGSCFVREHMTKDNLQTVSPDDNIEKVLAIMEKNNSAEL